MGPGDQSMRMESKFGMKMSKKDTCKNLNKTITILCGFRPGAVGLSLQSHRLKATAAAAAASDHEPPAPSAEKVRNHFK